MNLIVLIGSYYFIVKDGARVGEEHIINDKMTLVDYERR